MTLAVVAAAVGLAVLSGDARLLRLPVSLAVLGLAGGCGAVAGVVRAVRDAGPNMRPGLLLCGIALSSTAWTVAYLHTPSDDYRLYEIAAQRWLSGADLYRGADQHNQLPLVPVALGGLRLTLGATLHGLGDQPLWQLTYLVVQLIQLLSSVALLGGLYAMAQQAGAPPPRAAILAGLLVAAAFPLRESLGNTQINVVVVALAIAAMVTMDRRPTLAGVCLAIGGALKLYPLALLPLCLVGRRWRLLGAFVVTSGALAVLLWPHWVAFASFARDSGVADAYRHVGLHAIVMNTTRSIVLASGGAEWRGLATGIWLMTVVAVALWAFRLSVLDQARAVGERRPLDISARLLASTILIFPLAWAHHFVFALPLVVCLWARDWPAPRYVLATGLILFVPAFDIYPLGVHRLAGLIVLLVA